MAAWDENLFEMTHQQRIVSMILGAIVGGGIAIIMWVIVWHVWIH